MDIAFNERGVTVSHHGLSVAGQMFALRDIRGVAVRTVHKNRIVPVAISLIGAALAVAGGIRASGALLVPGAMLVVVGYLSWTTQDVTYRLILDTQDGKREALSSVDLDFVERVADVLRDAQRASSELADRPAS